MLALSARREHPLSAGWNVIARATVAVDAPGAGARMIEATPALLSAWEAALVQRTETLKGAHTVRIAVEQPLRAESGRAVLTVPNGRTKTGETTYAHHTFGLSPSRRELRMKAAYQRPLPLGEAIVHATVAISPGHAPGAPETLVGAAWRWKF